MRNHLVGWERAGSQPFLICCWPDMNILNYIYIVTNSKDNNAENGIVLEISGLFVIFACYVVLGICNYLGSDKHIMAF